MAKKQERITTVELCKMFGVTHATVHLWRKDISKIGRTPVPFHTEPRGARHRVYFLLQEVTKWAKTNHVVPKEPKYD